MFSSLVTQLKHTLQSVLDYVLKNEYYMMDKFHNLTNHLQFYYQMEILGTWEYLKHEKFGDGYSSSSRLSPFLLSISSDSSFLLKSSTDVFKISANSDLCSSSKLETSRQNVFLAIFQSLQNTWCHFDLWLCFRIL